MTTHIIKSGETISGIAKQYGTSISELMKLNPKIKNPNLIYAGEDLNLPSAPTTEQLKPIEEQIKEAQAKIPAIQTGIKELTEKKETPTLPEITYDQTKPDDKSVTNILTGAATGSAYADQLMKQIEDLNKRIDEEQKEKKTWAEKIFAPPEKTREERLTELRTQYGIPEKLDLLQQQNIKVTQLKSEIDKLDIDRQTEIDRIYNIPGQGMDFIRGEVNEINRLYDSKKAYLSAQLGAEAALLQAYAGNLDAANSLVNDSVNAFLWDYTEQINRWKFAYTYHTDIINSLTAEQRDILNKAYQESVRQYNDAREDKTNVMNLMLKYPQAGITIDDTTDSATEKASKWQATQSAEVPTERKAMANISTFLESKRGTDGYVSAADYQEAWNKYAKAGGTIAGFIKDFPKGSYLNTGEIEKLPAFLGAQSATTQANIGYEGEIRFALSQVNNDPAMAARLVWEQFGANLSDMGFKYNDLYNKAVELSKQPLPQTPTTEQPTQKLTPNKPSIISTIGNKVVNWVKSLFSK